MCLHCLHPRPARAHRPRRLGPQPHDHQSREGQGRGGDKRWRERLNGRDAPLASHPKPPFRPELGPRRYLLAMALPGSTMGTFGQVSGRREGRGKAARQGAGIYRPMLRLSPCPSPGPFGWAQSCLLSAAAKSLQSCPTLCDPIDDLLPGSSVPGILQARALEWVAISFSNA